MRISYNYEVIFSSSSDTVVLRKSLDPDSRSFGSRSGLRFVGWIWIQLNTDPKQQCSKAKYSLPQGQRRGWPSSSRSPPPRSRCSQPRTSGPQDSPASRDVSRVSDADCGGALNRQFKKEPEPRWQAFKCW